MVRQDWGRFKLDAFLPMLYHTFYESGPEFVKKYTQEAVRTVKQPVHSGIYIPELDATQFAAAIEAGLAGGASGISIFDFGSMNAERWAVVAKALATVMSAIGYDMSHAACSTEVQRLSWCQ